MFQSRSWSKKSSKSGGKHGSGKRSYKPIPDHLSTHPKEEKNWYEVDEHSMSMEQGESFPEEHQPNAKPALMFTPPSLPDLRSQVKRDDQTAVVVASAEDYLNTYPPSPYELNNIHPFQFNTSLNESFGSSFTAADSTLSSVSGVGGISTRPDTPHPPTTPTIGRRRSNTLQVPVSPLSPYIVARYVVKTPTRSAPFSVNRTPTPVFNSTQSHSRSPFQSTPVSQLQASDSLASISTHESLELLDTTNHTPPSASLVRPTPRPPTTTVFQFPTPPSRNSHERSSLRVGGGGRPSVVHHQGSLTASASQLSIHSLRSDVSASAGSTITTRSDMWMSRGQYRANSASRFRSFRRQTVPDPRFHKAYRSLRNNYYTGCMLYGCM